MSIEPGPGRAVFARIGFVTPSGPGLLPPGIGLLVLRDLMGHTHAETTAADMHLAPER